jgi:hypothetical protein
LTIPFDAYYCINTVFKVGRWLFFATAGIIVISLLPSCGRDRSKRTLTVEPGKRFDDFRMIKIWEKDFYGRWCLPCPNGIVCSELGDRSNREYKFYLYDYSGKLIKERTVEAGQGPDQIQGSILDAVWLSPSGDISIVDVDGYLKVMDPETLEIRTILKFSNVIPGYGSRFDVGRISGTTWQEKGGRIVTTFESTGFYEDLTYFLVSFSSAFRNFKINATAKKAKPLAWVKMEESHRQGRAQLESLIDYYGRWRIYRIFSADWKRNVVYLIPDIEKPEIESVNLESRQRLGYSIDIDFTQFAVEREEFDFFNEYASSEMSEMWKQRTKSISYIPEHTPALMDVMVVGDHLLLITGRRNWQKGENETLVYHLPDLGYEGSFAIPYSNIQKTKWCDPYFVTVNTVKKEEDYTWHYSIFKLTKRPAMGDSR